MLDDTCLCNSWRWFAKCCLKNEKWLTVGMKKLTFFLFLHQFLPDYSWRDIVCCVLPHLKTRRWRCHSWRQIGLQRCQRTWRQGVYCCPVTTWPSLPHLCGGRQQHIWRLLQRSPGAAPRILHLVRGLHSPWWGKHFFFFYSFYRIMISRIFFSP